MYAVGIHTGKIICFVLTDAQGLKTSWTEIQKIVLVWHHWENPFLGTRV